MEIINHKQAKAQEVVTLKSGDLFVRIGSSVTVYMKTDEQRNGCCICVSLNAGNLIDLPFPCSCIVLDGKLKLYEV